MRDVPQRLRRLLYIVPYVAKHPEGVLVDDLAKMLNAERDELLADLDLLSQVGPPDGDPGEYLLVSVEEGRVFVDLAHRLTRPLRLTPAEGCSLLLGIRALRESGIAPFDAAMQSAEKKLLTALGRDAREAEALATSTVVASISSPADAAVTTHLRSLVTAARQRQRVELDPDGDCIRTRDVEPLAPIRLEIEVRGTIEPARLGHRAQRRDPIDAERADVAALVTVPDDIPLAGVMDDAVWIERPALGLMARSGHVVDLDALALARGGDERAQVGRDGGICRR